MAVTAVWSEYNSGAASYSAPSTSDITNTNWGSSDSSNLNTTTFPITAGTNSFNKQHAVRFTITAGETVNNFYFWCATLAGAGDIPGNSDLLVYKDTGAKTLAAPSASAISASSNVPSSTPGSPNILGGPVFTTGDGSNIFLHQVQVNAATAAGVAGLQLSFRYDVIA